ncbi:MAG TPA: acetyl-CoA carboxylase biotin carboxyl carrier protein [Beijerinckiaceae bacterium]|jgi:acetyl-CoA carboxylase biotin carboxyl carrier protein
MTKNAKTASASREAEDAQPSIDVKLVEDLGAILTRLDLAELEVERDGLRVRVTRHAAAPVTYAAHAPAPMHAAPPAVIAPPPVAAGAAPAGDADHAGAVKSPMVGTAYRRPSPDAKPFVEVGSVVKAGEKILLVEAMKTFNEIVAPRAGTITAIHVEDGQPVEYGQTLLVIE